MVLHDEGTLNALPMPGWLLRPDCLIEWANPSASKLARNTPGDVSAVGFVRRIGSLELSPTLMDSVEREGHRRQVVALTIDRRDPVRATAHLTRCSVPTGSVLLVLVSDTSDPQDDEAWIALLARRFELTRTEASMLSFLTAGADAHDLAQAHGVAIVTVRTHLRSLREKTGRRSQLDLLRLGLGR